MFPVDLDWGSTVTTEQQQYIHSSDPLVTMDNNTQVKWEQKRFPMFPAGDGFIFTLLESHPTPVFQVLL